MKLIPMTDFVLQNKANFKGYKTEEIGTFNYNLNLIYERYANFLKQPLTLGMFVPAKLVNGEWIVLNDPVNYDAFLENMNQEDFKYFIEECLEYQEAKQRVLFEGINKESAEGYLYYNDLVEHLCDRVSLTESAKQQIGL